MLCTENNIGDKSQVIYNTHGQDGMNATRDIAPIAEDNPEPTDGSMTLKRRLIQAAVIGSGLIWASDIIYKIVNDVSYVNRERCILYKSLPKIGFVVFEYFFETLVIVFVGIFLAVLLSRWFLRFQRFYPRNPVTAFLSASVIPVCACALIPLLSAMKGKMKFATTMSFVLTAPLLSPYILVLSFSVLGFTYGMLRIASAFILVMITAFILGYLQRNDVSLEPAGAGGGCAQTCGAQEGDVYLETFKIFKGLLLPLLIGGAIGVLLEYLGPRAFLLNGRAGRGVPGVLAWILIGAPLYFCNGAEVLFLRPLVNHGLPLGTAIGFSMTSTTICATSIAMLLKIIGSRLTVALVACVVLISLALALVVNAML